MELQLLLAAVIPPLLLLWYFHASDRYPEPPRMIWMSFLLGALVLVPVALLEVIAQGSSFRITQPWAKGSLTAFLAAAFPEELAKLLVLTRYCHRRCEFDEPMDGLVYGSAVALGFAALENVLYVFYYDPGMGTAMSRALTAVPFHGAMGAIMGYFFGLAGWVPKRKRLFFALALLVPTLFHGLYDGALLIAHFLPKGDAMKGPLALTFLGLLATMLYIAWGLHRESCRIQRCTPAHADDPSSPHRSWIHRLAGWLGLLAAGFVLGLSAYSTAETRFAFHTFSPILRVLCAALGVALLWDGTRVILGRDRGAPGPVAGSPDSRHERIPASTAGRPEPAVVKSGDAI